MKRCQVNVLWCTEGKILVKFCKYSGDHLKRDDEKDAKDTHPSKTLNNSVLYVKEATVYRCAIK